MSQAMRDIEIIAAPSNLGLRPLHPGHVPGTWRAPEVLLANGLSAAVGARRVRSLNRPTYSPERQPGTGLYNGHAMRAFNLDLADHVAAVLESGGWPLVPGGDCSILLGALAGCRRHGPVSLVHLDGHSDFRHPGNYDSEARLGAVAGMDLALATGRGEPLMTDWPGIAAPLVPDERVIQIGEREGRDADFAWPDVRQSGIERIEIFDALEIGMEAVAQLVFEQLNKAECPRFWLHLDVDVLDQSVMPAVDSPGSPGLDASQLIRLARRLLQAPGSIGMTVTVFDPDLDPSGALARELVRILGAMHIGSRRSTSKQK